MNISLESGLSQSLLYFFPGMIREATQGKDVVPGSIVRGPQDWVAADFKGECNLHKWQYQLTSEDIAEIDAALMHVKGLGIRIEVSACLNRRPLPSSRS